MNNTAQKTETTVIDATAYAATTEAIRTEAAKLLTEGKVAAVVGYIPGRRKGTAIPGIVTDPEQAKDLLFSPACVNNLALYLTKAKKEVSKKGRLAIVAKGCDMRALAGLMGESQLKREDVVIIGVACAGVHGSGIHPAEPLTSATIARKCRECTVHEPTGADLVCGKVPTLPELIAVEQEELAKLEAMTPQERWAYWKEQFKPPPGGRQLPPSCGQHGLAHRARHAPGRQMRRLRGVRTGMPHGYPAQSAEPQDGAGAKRAVRS